MAIDGTAFYVAITSMMPARTFHLTQDAYFFAAFFFAQFLLALTGIGFIAMPSMVVAFGIPEVAIATVIGIEPILDMCGTAQSVLGNITSSLLVGRRLGRWTRRHTAAPIHNDPTKEPRKKIWSKNFLLQIFSWQKQTGRNHR